MPFLMFDAQYVGSPVIIIIWKFSYAGRIVWMQQLFYYDIMLCTSCFSTFLQSLMVLEISNTACY